MARQTLVILSAAALLMVVFAPAARAQSATNNNDAWHNSDLWSLRPIDKSTRLTFSGPVSLPGVTLPAGTYLFRFADPNDAPDVLQVLSEDGQTSYALLSTVPIVRTKAETNDSEIVTFRETPVSSPAALDAWYFDDTVGCEVIYEPTK